MAPSSKLSYPTGNPLPQPAGSDLGQRQMLVPQVSLACSPSKRTIQASPPVLPRWISGVPFQNVGDKKKQVRGGLRLLRGCPWVTGDSTSLGSAGPRWKVLSTEDVGLPIKAE